MIAPPPPRWLCCRLVASSLCPPRASFRAVAANAGAVPRLMAQSRPTGVHGDDFAIGMLRPRRLCSANRSRSRHPLQMVVDLIASVLHFCVILLARREEFLEALSRRAISASLFACSAPAIVICFDFRSAFRWPTRAECHPLQPHAAQHFVRSSDARQAFDAEIAHQHVLQRHPRRHPGRPGCPPGLTGEAGVVALRAGHRQRRVAADDGW